MNEFDPSYLARIWCSLNNYEWPEALGPKPPSYTKDDRTWWPVMKAIETTIGLKECLREWNKDNKPGDEFDQWWDRQHE